MQFVASEDVAAAPEVVWQRVSDFSAFEARIRKTGGVTRTPDGPVTPETTWVGKAPFRGKTYEAKVALLALEPERHLEIEATTNGMVITVEVELQPLTPATTRLTVTTNAKARTLAARLILQSAKLGRQALAKRYKARIAAFAETVEQGAAV